MNLEENPESDWLLHQARELDNQYESFGGIAQRYTANIISSNFHHPSSNSHHQFSTGIASTESEFNDLTSQRKVLDDSKKDEGRESEIFQVRSVQFDHQAIKSQSNSLGPIVSPAEESKYAEISTTLDERGNAIKEEDEGVESESAQLRLAQFDHQAIETRSNSLGPIVSPAEESKYAEISASLDERGNAIKEKVSKSICSKRAELLQILEKEFGPCLFDARENGSVTESSPHPDTLWITALSGKYGTNQGFVLSAYYHPSERHTATTIGKLGLQIAVGEAGQLAISFQTRARSGNKCYYNTEFVGHCYNRERETGMIDFL